MPCLVAPAHLAPEASRLEQRQQTERPAEWMLATELVAEGTGYAGAVGSKLERQPQRRGLMVDAVGVHAASLRPARPDVNKTFVVSLGVAVSSQTFVVSFRGWRFPADKSCGTRLR